MPGRIIAQIAIAPERNMNHQASGVSAGERREIAAAAAIPATIASRCWMRNLPTPFSTKKEEARIRPKKRLQT